MSLYALSAWPTSPLQSLAAELLLAPYQQQALASPDLSEHERIPTQDKYYSLTVSIAAQDVSAWRRIRQGRFRACMHDEGLACDDRSVRSRIWNCRWQNSRTSADSKITGRLRQRCPKRGQNCDASHEQPKAPRWAKGTELQLRGHPRAALVVIYDTRACRKHVLRAPRAVCGNGCVTKPSPMLQRFATYPATARRLRRETKRYALFVYEYTGKFTLTATVSFARQPGASGRR